MALRNSAISFSTDLRLRLQLGELAALLFDLLVDRGDRPCAGDLRRLQRGDLLLLLVRERSEALRLGRDLFADQGQVLELVVDVRNAARPRPAEIAVIGQHAPEGRWIFLIQKKFELFFATVDVGGPQFARQRASFGIEFLLTLQALLLEFLQTCVRCNLLRPHGLELLPRRLHAEFRIAQLYRQLVPLLHIVVDGLADLVDPLVELAQFGFFLRWRRRLRAQHCPGQPGRHEQQQTGDPPPRTAVIGTAQAGRGA